MARADQIYVMRPLVGIDGVYQHHGIDYGDGSIIHYRKTGDQAIISRTSFETFSWGNLVYPVHHPLVDSADVVIERAESRLGEEQYDLFFNNCEHFATWCKTGRRESAQLANFGLRLEQLSLPEFRHLAASSHNPSPDQALRSCQRAIADIAVAYQTSLTQQQAAQAEVESWQRVAQRALAKNREDLARAALHRKVEARGRVQRLTEQLQQLVELELNLQRQRDRVAADSSNEGNPPPSFIP